MKDRRHVNARDRRADHCVFGVHAVEEHLRAHPERVAKVSLTNPDRRRTIVELAEAGGIDVVRVTTEKLDELTGGGNHQGAMLTLRSFEYANLERIVAARPPIVVAADGVEDPRNLGALIRSAAAAGAGGLIIPRDRAASVTPVVEKAAAGTTAWFPVVQVTNLVRTLEELKETGQYWIIGLSAEADRDAYAGDLPLPAVVVVGGEGGLRPLVARSCDVRVRVPMDGRVESLNLSVAGALVLFELRRQHSGVVLTGTRSGARKHDSHQN